MNISSAKTSRFYKIVDPVVAFGYFTNPAEYFTVAVIGVSNYFFLKWYNKCLFHQLIGSYFDCKENNITSSTFPFACEQSHSISRASCIIFHGSVLQNTDLEK